MNDGYRDVLTPKPIADLWTPERSARGGGVTITAPRCPEPGCAVVYAAGADRRCPDHDGSDADGSGPYGYVYRGTGGDELAAELAAAELADDRAAARAQQLRGSATAAAASWLVDYLACHGGRALSVTIHAAAADAGYRPGTLKMARERLLTVTYERSWYNGANHTDWILTSNDGSNPPTADSDLPATVTAECQPSVLVITSDIGHDRELASWRDYYAANGDHIRAQRKARRKAKRERPPAVTAP